MRSYRLGEISSVAAGQSAPQDRRAFSDDGIPFIRAGSLESLCEGGTESNCERVQEDCGKKYGLRLFPKDTVVFAKSGMSATKNRVYRLRTPCFLVSHLAGVVLNRGVSPNYLEHWFRANPPSRLIRDDSYPSIRTSELEALDINLPAYDEQTRIAAILDKADAVCRKRHRALELADEFLRSVFLDMFGDPVTNPKRWDPAPVRDLARVTTGSTPSREIESYYGSHIEWIKSDNINTPSHFLTQASESLSESGLAVGRIARNGSTLITCIAGSPDCIGNAALADRDVAFNQQINALTPSGAVSSEFLYMLVVRAKRLIQAASTNSMKGMVNKSSLEEVMLFRPPFPLQKKFAGIFTFVNSTVIKLNRDLSLSNSLFNSLTQRAFRGEL